MLRLMTFGGLTLLRDGAPHVGPASQRRRLALLALVAVAGKKGLPTEIQPQRTPRCPPSPQLQRFRTKRGIFDPTTRRGMPCLTR